MTDPSLLAVHPPTELEAGPARTGFIARLSLDRKLYALLLLAALPLSAVIGYQAWCGWRNSLAISQEFPRYVLALERQAQFQIFADGLADAVDTGTVSAKAAKAAQDTRRISADLQALGGPATPALEADISAVADAVAGSRDLKALMPLRERIMRAQKEIGARAVEHHASLDEIVTASIHAARRDTAVVLLVVALSIGLALAVGRRLIAVILRLVARLEDAAGSIAEESRLLSAEASQARGRAVAQESEVDAVNQAMASMLADITEVATNAKATAAAAGQTRSVAAEAERHMQANSASQVDMLARVGESTNAIRTLSRAIGSIGEITTAIRQIAHQTNLLAINASIEAARAGVQGRGFAVVATEVRHLAEATSSSTNDIKSRVENVERDAEQAVKTIASVTVGSDQIGRGIDSTSDILRQIIAAAQNLNTLADRIASTAEQQDQAARHVASSMARMHELTHENGGGIERVSATSQTLVQTAQGLLGQVLQLRGGQPMPA
jgi:methyl-accepting chemotaxis protein